MLYPPEQLVLPSCHPRLALVILQFLAKYLLDGLRVQFQCTHGFVPGYLLGQTWRNSTNEEGVDDVCAS